MKPGSYHSQEARQKMREHHWSKHGYPHPMLGKHQNQEAKEKIRIARKGKRNSPRTEFKKGQHASPATEIKRGERRFPETEFTSERLKSLWQNPDYRRKVTTGLKDKNKGKKRPDLRVNRFVVGCGPDNPFYGKRHSEETKAKIRAARMKRRFPKSNTIPEKAFIGICQKYNLPFKYVGDGQVWIGHVNPDFVDVNGKKIAIDIFGDYWHTPLFRQEAIRFTYTEQGRKLTLKKYGWKLIVIWQSELKLPNAEEKILGKLRKGGVKV